MGFKQLNERCYVYEASVNIGYVHQHNQGLIIDTGIDKSSVRKIVRELEEKQLPITHLFITHAHADHYGGAYYLKEKYSVKIIAPRFEAVILQNPILEPIYLFSGNEPIDELRNKFLEGRPVEVDLIVDEGEISVDNFQLNLLSTPGHSYNQMAVAVDDILYAADSYFGKEELAKHKIPYITNAEMALKSLRKLLNTSFKGAVPGHGYFESDYISTIKKNIEYHEMIIHKLVSVIDKFPDGLTHEQAVVQMCEVMNVETKQLSQFLLFKTAITAYITLLIKEEKIEHYIQQNRWMFKIKKSKG
ncbi:MBL fold metallo-hydrolase [Bacillaceae bacterium W0354]